MAKPKVYSAKWQEDGSAFVLSRIMRKDADRNLVPAVPADVASIVRRVFTTSDGAVVTGPDTLVVADTILDELSTGDIWTVDSTGFNFDDTIPPTAFPTGDVEYRVEYKITMADGFVAWLSVKGKALPILTS